MRSRLKTYKGKSYEVDLRLGKPIDICSLKSDMIQNFSRYVMCIKSTRRQLFRSKELERVKYCPVCKKSTKGSRFLISIYSGHYHQMPKMQPLFLN